MKRFLFALIATVLCAVQCSASDPGDVSRKLQDISVTIKAGSTEGSGVIKTRDGTNYIWTAGHVVERLRSTRGVIDPATGSQRTVVEFRDAQIIKQLVEDGRTVGKVEFDAEVIRYSNADTGHDLALLKLRKKNFVSASADFYLGDDIPPIASELYHVGSLLGQLGSNSFTTGVMSQHGRLFQGKTYDQTTCTAFPGSSGGGVYLKDGRYVGMLVRGAGEGFNLIVPVRRMRDWSRSAGVEWAIDDAVPVPSADEMSKMPIEDIGSKFGRDESKSDGDPKSFRYWIRSSDCPCGDACKCDPCECGDKSKPAVKSGCGKWGCQCSPRVPPQP